MLFVKNLNLTLSVYKQQEKRTHGLLLSPKSVMGLQEALSFFAACYILNGMKERVTLA